MSATGWAVKRGDEILLNTVRAERHRAITAWAIDYRGAYVQTGTKEEAEEWWGERAAEMTVVEVEIKERTP